MATAQWELVQTGPPNKRLVLQGYSAPFGRLRKDAVASSEFELRRSKSYYAGRRVPTRQIFGDQESDIVLNGRWTDQVLGAGGANTQVQYVKQMIVDGVTCTLSWGTFIAYVVLPAKIKVDRETGSDVKWELTCEVDEDLDLQTKAQRITVTESPSNDAAAITSAMQRSIAQIRTGPFPQVANDLSPTFLDQLDSLVNAANFASAQLLNALGVVNDYKSALVSDLGRIRGGIDQLKGAMLGLQNFVDSVVVDAISYARWADTDFSWFQYSSAQSDQMNGLYGLLVNVDVQTRDALRGSSAVTTRAQDGDTFETMAVRVYGSADSAQKIKDANGVLYGALPVVGKDYVCPDAF